jgi:subtilisin-like proprotein convertase family protein
MQLLNMPLPRGLRLAGALASLALMASALPAHAVETGCVASSGTGCVALIPDGPLTGITSTLTVPAGVCGGAAATGVSVRVNVVHNNIGDLSISVRNPANVSASLVNALSGPPAPTCEGDDISAVFQDGGAAATCQSASVPSLSGTVAPAASLAPLVASTTGVWTLTVTDLVHSNNGALSDWGVDVTCAPLAPADVGVVLSGFPAGSLPNSTVNGTITCTSLGGQAAANANCTVTGGTTSACTLQPANTLTVLPVASLPVTQSIRCAVSAPTGANGLYSVVGTAAATVDSNPNNNTANAAGGTLVGPADVNVVFSGFPLVTTPNSNVNGTVTCTNIGGQAATNVNCTVTGGTTSACMLQPGNTPVVLPLASLLTTQSITCSVTAPVGANGLYSVVGTAVSTNDSNASNNTANSAAGTLVVTTATVIPTLSEWMLLLLALMVGAAAVASTRRNRT